MSRSVTSLSLADSGVSFIRNFRDLSAGPTDQREVIKELVCGQSHVLKEEKFFNSVILEDNVKPAGRTQALFLSRI